MKNVVHQALGAGHQFAEPHLGAVAHQPGERFLLCSDGVNDGLWNRELDELIRTPPPERATQPPAQRIVESAVARSGRDNATAVVVEILPSSPSTS